MYRMDRNSEEYGQALEELGGQEAMDGLKAELEPVISSTLPYMKSEKVNILVEELIVVQGVRCLEDCSAHVEIDFLKARLKHVEVSKLVQRFKNGGNFFKIFF